MFKCYAFFCVYAILGGVRDHPPRTHGREGREDPHVPCVWPPRPPALGGLARQGLPPWLPPPKPSPGLPEHPAAMGLRRWELPLWSLWGASIPQHPSPPPSTCRRDPLGSVCSARLVARAGTPHTMAKAPQNGTGRKQWSTQAPRAHHLAHWRQALSVLQWTPHRSPGEV